MLYKLENTAQQGIGEQMSFFITTLNLKSEHIFLKSRVTQLRRYHGDTVKVKTEPEL